MRRTNLFMAGALSGLLAGARSSILPVIRVKKRFGPDGLEFDRGRTLSKATKRKRFCHPETPRCQKPFASGFLPGTDFDALARKHAHSSAGRTK